MNAVITGASRGIGKAVAEIFARHGYHLLLNARNEPALLQTVAELRKKYPSITIEGRAADLGHKAEAKVFGEWASATAGSVEVLVNNAGTFLPGSVINEADGTLEEMMQVNLYSAYYVTKAVVPKMMAKKSGHIFTLCSIAGLQAYENGGAYSISKFALIGYTKNLRHELKEHGIKVTAVIPGAVYTDSWAGFVAPERIMEANDIAAMIYACSLLSPQAVVEELVLRPQLGDL